MKKISLLSLILVANLTLTNLNAMDGEFKTPEREPNKPLLTSEHSPEVCCNTQLAVFNTTGQEDMFDDLIVHKKGCCTKLGEKLSDCLSGCKAKLPKISKNQAKLIAGVIMAGICLLFKNDGAPDFLDTASLMLFGALWAEITIDINPAIMVPAFLGLSYLFKYGVDDQFKNHDINFETGWQYSSWSAIMYTLVNAIKRKNAEQQPARV